MFFGMGLSKWYLTLGFWNGHFLEFDLGNFLELDVRYLGSRAQFFLRHIILDNFQNQFWV